jgi:hypothetical protein
MALVGCETKHKDFFILKGEIKGLTKGTLYLEKVRDNKYVLVDSFRVKNDGIFEMSDSLYSPEVYYLRLKEKPKEEIQFFAEQGRISIHSKLDKFSSKVKISGSENQDLWGNYQGIMRKFNDENLDLVKEKFMAQKDKNQSKIDSLERIYKKHVKRKYLYATNFAVKNAAKEVAPYIALSDLYDANIYLLDTIEKSMSAQIKLSMYGKKLTEFVKKIKETERDTLK